MEKEEKNVLKHLTYISKINKSIKNMKKLYQESMKSLKFVYEENKSNIKYEEYYFNGIPIPNNIEFKDITSSNINIFWEIDNINYQNKLKYKVEMKKSYSDFEKVFEGEKNNCIINNLESNTEYEFRICSFYNNSFSAFSNIHKIKTSNIDSNILKKSKREDEFLQKLLEWSGCKKIELLYRVKRDGMTG